MRRAAVSIPANLAEGCGRTGDAELARYFQIAMGSASEFDYELLLAHDLGYSSDSDYLPAVKELTEIRKMLNTFIQKLRSPALR